MKTTKTLSLLLLGFSLLFFFSCSSDDDNHNPDSPGSGEPHTYELTITGGQLDGQVLSGVIENKPDDDVVEDGAIATTAFVNSNDNPNLKLITLYIRDEQLSIHGWLVQNKETGSTENFGSGDEDATTVSSLTISVTPSDEFGKFLEGTYVGTEGTITLTNVKLLSFLTTAGLAAFRLEVEGTFITPLSDEPGKDLEEAHISGEIVINVPVDEEWMEDM